MLAFYLRLTVRLSTSRFNRLLIASTGWPWSAVSQSDLRRVRSCRRKLSRQRDRDLRGLPAIPQVLADQS
jgi:hypothetical protein